MALCSSYSNIENVYNDPFIPLRAIQNNLEAIKWAILCEVMFATMIVMTHDVTIVSPGIDIIPNNAAISMTNLGRNECHCPWLICKGDFCP
jgi:hypothetical protein